MKYNKSSLMLSSLQEYFQPLASKGFAVKYVAEGVEKYTLDKEVYDVVAGTYLLSNTINSGYVEIDSHKPVHGICINIDTTLLETTIASIVRPDAAIPDTDLAAFFTKALFIENVYRAAETKLGAALTQLNTALQTGTISIDTLSHEFFYSISEKIVADYTPVCKQLQSIPAVKPITKKELYQKILKGKKLIDEFYATGLTIGEIAKECCISEYHFFRMFKIIFRLSPHQYIIGKRLSSGRKMIEKHHYSVSAAAIECGFSDIHTFSSAFRNYFGFTPSSLLPKNSRIS